MSDLILNARFLTRPQTGVDRVAQELTAALIEDRPGLRIRALCPREGVVHQEDRPTALMQHVQRSASSLKGQLWEQVHLAGAHKNDWLLSLCNMGPVWRKRQIVMIHDAQVFRQPDSYSRAFRGWYQLLQPLLGRRAAMVLTVSEHSKHELEQFGVVPSGKTRVVPNGADHILRIGLDGTALARWGLERGRYFLALGSLAPHKNLAMLVAAAKAREDQSIPLVIAGGGNATVFSSNGIVSGEGIRVLGRVSEAELRTLYEYATALAFPSLTEGFGLPPAEAMFCGCPVISSTGGAIPEVCGSATLALGPYDQAGWTRAMEELAENSGLRHSLSERGRAQAAKFTWRAAAKRLASHLSELPN
ncbi:glycosyltransferase family 4 protein [Pelagibacterium sp.]|uniref:glycosyltransferase family 4 protein n=1 Tax=Pelagibacterium sp. TaxID=1967288 RepID=UPI003A93A702